MIHGDCSRGRCADSLTRALAIALGLVGINAPHLFQQFLGIRRACIWTTRAAVVGFLLFPRSRGGRSVDAFGELCVGIAHGLYLRVIFKLRSNVSTSGALSMAAL